MKNILQLTRKLLVVFVFGICCLGNLYAYTVTLRTSNCVDPIVYTVTNNSTQSILAHPLDGYHFGQWNDGNTDNPRTIVVTSDLTYTATLLPNEYEVVLYMGADSVVFGNQIVTFNESYGDLPVPTLTGYTFDGWFTAADGGDLVVASTPYTTVGNTALFAHWTINTYTVNGEEYEYGETVVLTPADKACYHFTQWSDGNTDNPRTITVTGDATYTEEYAINQYSITFQNEDGTELQQSDVNCGELPEYTGATPTKAATDEFSYAFNGWNTPIVAVHADAVYTAVFTESRNNYTLTVKSANCTESATYTVAYGESIDLEPISQTGWHFTEWSDGNTDNPRTVVVVSDTTFIANFVINTYIVNGEEHEYGETVVLTPADKACYHFTQWSDGNTDNPRTITVTGDATYTEVYEINQYMITFQNEDGTELQQSNVNCGELPEYTGATPIKTATDEFSYSFNGWNKTITEASEDATYTATFTAKTNTYTVNGEEHEYGETVVLTPADKSCYHFTQWNDGNTDNPRTITVTGDATYTEVYEIDQFTITFENEDGTELQSDLVDCGTLPVYTGETPTKSATAEFTYTFKAWNKSIAEASEDATYTATFTATTNSYTINGEEYEYGETVVLTPADKLCYHFTQWSDGNTDNPRTITVTGDATYTEVYEINQYMITFENEDGTELQQSNVNCGELPEYTGATPTKTATAEFTYSFNGWNKTITEASEDAFYTATFTAKTNTYTVNGEEHEYGETVVLTPADKACYHFTQWSDGNTDNPRTITVTGDATYTEVYEINQYVITFENEDGTELQQSNVNCGELPEYTGATPTKTATAEFTYSFNGWNKTITEASEDATYTATFKTNKQEFVVNGETYEYGEQITLTAEDKNCQHFVQWSDGNTDNPRTIIVTEDATYIAQYAVNHIALPNVEIYPQVVYGDTLHTISATLNAWSQIDQLTYGDEVTRLWWEWNTGNGFVPYNGDRVLSSNVNLRYGIEACEGIQYSAASGSKQPEPATADNCEDCANAPAVAMYDWMIMVDQKTLNQKGYLLSPDQVVWYKVIGKVDNMSSTKGEHNDVKVATGLYLTAKSPLTGTGLYYAVITPASISSSAKCKGKLRTEIFNFTASGGMLMYPTVVSGLRSIQLTGLPEEENVQVYVYNEVGVLMRKFTSNNQTHVMFQSEEARGVYIVKVVGKKGEEVFKYIVK